MNENPIKTAFLVANDAQIFMTLCIEQDPPGTGGSLHQPKLQKNQIQAIDMIGQFV
jgi:hypothetical protein